MQAEPPDGCFGILIALAIVAALAITGGIVWALL
jgi:hypothetical protein